MLLPLLLSVIPAILIGWALGGRLSGLAQLNLRWIWLIAAGLIVQVVAMGYVGRSWSFVTANRPAIIVGMYLLVLIGLARNWRVPGMVVVTVGFALNFTVILANGGQMPVTRQTMEASGQGWLIADTRDGQPVDKSKDILLPKEDTRLWALSDIFITPPPVRRAASLGDFVTFAGVALAIVACMRRAQTAAVPAVSTAAAA
jgi:hypothetical protein